VENIRLLGRSRNKPLGLITVRDIVRKVCIYDNVTISSVKNAAIVSFPLIIIKSDSTPEAAADLLIENKIKHLLVVDKEDADKPVDLLPLWQLAQDIKTAGKAIAKAILSHGY
jgi:CBS domain-containing protein